MSKKSRFDGIDVAAMTSHLKHTLLGFKLVNVYDGSALLGGGDKNASVYIFKLADPSGGGVENQEQETEDPTQSKRVMLLMESGVRFHPTVHYTQSNSSSTMPSSFAMKLRKHLRSLRLENISQLGKLDRVVDFRFGSGTSAHHIVLELYGRGNLILTDGDYKILGLLRNFEYEIKEEGVDIGIEKENEKKEEVKVRVGNVYPVTFATTLTAPADDETENIDANNINDPSGKHTVDSNSTQGLLSMNAIEAYEWARSKLLKLSQKSIMNKSTNSSDCGSGNLGKKKGAEKSKKKASMDDSVALKALLLRPDSGVYHYGPSLIEHCISSSGIDPTVKLSYDNIEYTLSESMWGVLLQCIRDDGSKVIDNLVSGESGGYILYKPKPQSTDTDNENAGNSIDGSSLPPTLLPNQNPHFDKTLLEFQPHLLIQHKDQFFLNYANFSMAVDEFFSHLSSQRLAQRADALESSARDRLSKIRLDQQKRFEGLALERERWKHSAQLVEMHAEDVDKALGVISSALDNGFDWNSLEQLVSMEKANENPIALLIHKLELDKDLVVLSLPDIEDWDESAGAPKLHHVSLSINESAHGNARQLFARYRASKEKEEKTAESSSMALEAAEAKAKRQLAEAQKKKEVVRLLPVRKPYWFEKFSWFITSDNYLVVAGKDAQQNEQLVKRYLRPGDAYLHAEVHGASSCILRAKRRRLANGKTQVMPLSERSLNEAGTFTICRSSAWTSKMVTSAYWVESHQVSKTAPTGEYLTVGSFMIRGRKNFLPASPLEMGIGVLFRLGDEASIARHINERRDFALIEHAEAMMSQQKSFVLAEGDGEAETHIEAVSKEGDTDDYPEEVQNGFDLADDQMDEPDPKLEDEDGESSSDAKTQLEQLSGSKNVTWSSQEMSLREKGGEINISTKNKQKELSRGNRTKKKRAKQKYSEQDDEDKELAMLALHGGESSKKGKKGKGSRIVPKQSESQQKAASETVALLIRDSKKVGDNLNENVRTILAQCVTVKVANGADEVRWNKFDAEVLEQLGAMDTLEEQLAAARRLMELSNSSRIDNFSASLAGIIRTVKKHGISVGDGVEAALDGKQRKSRAEKQAEKEAWHAILAEDGIIDNDGDDDGAVDDTAELSKLTGRPFSDDLLLCAVPVCAPYQVLSQYKYRVKLTPGSQKRGKASKQCLELFLHGENDKLSVDDGVKRDREFIKLVNENEWVQCIIGDVRITSAGASKVIKKQKGTKSKDKK